MMGDLVLEKLFEHNHWANLQILNACTILNDEQLDAEPSSAMYGSIRQTLIHLVKSQQGYLRLLTVPVEERRLQPLQLDFENLLESAKVSGEGLIELVHNLPENPLPPRVQTTDDFYVHTEVVLLQVINHATEHREQIKSMLSAFGKTPPEIDGWSYGEFTHTLVPISS